MTAWTQAGSLTSDRLQPRQRPPPKQAQQRNKGKHSESDHPKSNEVQELEQILQGLRRGKETIDSKDGCFCQARLHSLSKYTPNCSNCGLVLCALQLPFRPCPYCSKSLVDDSSFRETLISRVEEEIKRVLQKEEEERNREQQEREQAEGAFPSLAATTGGTTEPRKNAQPRNVLSLNPKTGKLMATTYTVPSNIKKPTKAQTAQRNVREPPPPSDVDYVKGKILDPSSWKNLRNESVMYVMAPSSNAEPVHIGKSGKRSKKT